MSLKHTVISYLTFYCEVYRSTDICNIVEKQHLKYVIESMLFCLNKQKCNRNLCNDNSDNMVFMLNSQFVSMLLLLINLSVNL